MYLGIYSIKDKIYFRANTVNQAGSAADATSGPTFTVYRNDASSAAKTGSMSKVGSKTGHYEGNFTATGFSTGQHFILIEATVDGQTPKAHFSFQMMEDEQSVLETFTDIETIAAAVPSVGDGTSSVDHNHGGADNLRVTTSSGGAISGATVRLYVRTDFDAGRKANQYVVGQTVTGSDGRWRQAIRVNPGKYTVQVTQGAFLSEAVKITVT